MLRRVKVKVVPPHLQPAQKQVDKPVSQPYIPRHRVKEFVPPP